MHQEYSEGHGQDCQRVRARTQAALALAVPRSPSTRAHRHPGALRMPRLWRRTAVQARRRRRRDARGDSPLVEGDPDRA